MFAWTGLSLQLATGNPPNVGKNSCSPNSYICDKELLMYSVGIYLKYDGWQKKDGVYLSELF